MAGCGPPFHEREGLLGDRKPTARCTAEHDLVIVSSLRQRIRFTALYRQ